MNGLLELLTTKHWMISPDFVHGVLPTMQYNLTMHSTLGIERDKKRPMTINAAGDDILREYEVTDDGTVLPVYDGWNGIDYLRDLKQPFVNVIPVDGPITRNGGACSYGSKEIRDWMMKGADNPFCQGHVMVVNTPGGSAWAKNDFQQAIDYAHSKGQRVIAFVDGLCASAGMYLAALCDEVYVMNSKCQLGCVGVMASFFTQKNGERNQFTGETYREYYDPESVDKNKQIRDIAEEEDATMLIEELAELGREFRSDMKRSFPNADVDEHLRGKIFDAEDVMGILCDGQMMLGEVITRVFALADGSEKPIGRTAGRKIGKREKTARREPMAQAVGAAQAAAGKMEHILNPQNNINMKEKFPQIFALLAVEEMECKEDGTFFNTTLLESLEAKIGEMQQQNADAKALADQLTADKAALEQQLTEKDGEMEQMKADHAAAVENLNAEHEKAMEALKADHAGAIEEKQNAIAALEQEKADLTADQSAKAEQIETLNGQLTEKQTELDGAKASLETAQQTIAERDQQVADLTAQVEELTKEPGKEPQAGAAPQNNGGGADAPKVAVGQYVYDNSLSYEENMRRKAEFEKAQKA